MLFLVVNQVLLKNVAILNLIPEFEIDGFH